MRDRVVQRRVRAVLDAAAFTEFKTDAAEQQRLCRLYRSEQVNERQPF